MNQSDIAVQETPVETAPVAAKQVAVTRAQKRPSRAPKLTDLIRPKRIADLVRAKNPRIELDYTVSSDPELFIQEVETGRIVSSIPILKRDKYNPIELSGGANAFCDNVAAEANILPSKTKDQMIARLKAVFVDLHELIGPAYRLIPKASHMFDADQLQPAFGVDPAQVGCSPSMCAYDLCVVTPEPFVDGLRTGSFHIHLGHDRLKEFETRQQAIKVLDIIAGTASVLLDEDTVASAARRVHYGRAGSLRCPSHGAEWRVLPPAPLRTIELTSLILDLVDHSLDHIRNGTAADLIASVDIPKLRAAINTCDKAVCEEILKGASISTALMTRIKADHGTQTMQQAWGI